MPIADLINALTWWFILFLVGSIFLPFTFFFLRNLFDNGYIFSKIIGAAIISYAIFVLGVAHILAFNKPSLIMLLSFFAIINFLIMKKEDYFVIYKKNRPIYLLEEILFLASFLFWVYIRAHQPDIHGLEKFMDFGFLNSILRSTYFPPKDMWFTPLPINYYYFGHLVTAVLTKISNIPSNITFNLMIATLFALTFMESFSIGANLISKLKNTTQNSKVVMGGLLTAFLVSFAGNLQTIYSFFSGYNSNNPLPFWQMPFSPFTFPNNYWYPNATRFIYHTIHEFPIYSFVVSDLHGHVLDVPFVLLIIAVLLSLFKNLNLEHPLKIRNLRLQIPLISFLLAVMYMTNAWDGLIYFLLAFLVLGYLILIDPSSEPPRIKNYELRIMDSFKIRNLKSKIYTFIIYLLLIAICFFIFSLPFNVNFKPFVSGIGINCAPHFLTKIGKIGPFLFEKNYCQTSPVWQLFILYGFFYFWAALFIIVKIKNQNSKVFKELKFNHLNLIENFKFRIKNFPPSDLFVLILILFSSVLIIAPEFFYLKDIYTTYFRANTMFKLVYQAFIMLSIASAYAITRIISDFKEGLKKRVNYWQLAAILIGGIGLFLVSIYPYFAINSYYDNLKTYHGLNGTAYLKDLYPSDYEAIQWLNAHVKGQPVILEAQGDSYTDYARVSANTGIPTVLGWTVHEWLWRGTYNIPAARIPDVKNLYEENNLKLTKSLLKKYNIKYIFIGDLERQKYPNLNENKFYKLGKIVFEKGQTKIFKIF
ncbi:DUF2298 domain-containing protein [Patescibacteria group bacterium]|nr:DUF2298 domain-containing protein [Patescibacteria group bacterium]MCL5010038.1 DUF2298 domain-containing protein [Patescibacteria group bacterium]